MHSGRKVQIYIHVAEARLGGIEYAMLLIFHFSSCISSLFDSIILRYLIRVGYQMLL